MHDVCACYLQAVLVPLQPAACNNTDVNLNFVNYAILETFICTYNPCTLTFVCVYMYACTLRACCACMYVHQIKCQIRCHGGAVRVAPHALYGSYRGAPAAAANQFNEQSKLNILIKGIGKMLLYTQDGQRRTQAERERERTERYKRQ